MSVFQLLIKLVEHFGLIVAGCFILMRLGALRKIVLKRANKTEKCFIALLFGGLGIVGTYVGVPLLDAIPNLRGMASITAGILGGPLVGMGAGFIAGGHRFLLGGFTALSCGLATLLEGFLAGLIYNHFQKSRLDWKVGFVIGVTCESLHMVIVLLIGRPFPDALALVRVVALPMILVNSLGIVVLIDILNTVFTEEERAGAVQAQRALKIATETVGYLRTGLHFQSAGETARIIHQMTDMMTVGVTDCDRILACVGAGADHHQVGKEKLASVTMDVIKTGRYMIVRDKAEVGCPVPNCPLHCGVIVPLRKKGQVVGTLSLYRGKGSRISQVDIELATGLAHLFAIQLELEEIQHQAQLLDRAEIKALQAQINPHFLFNALHTIVSFCRTDIEKARELLIHLGNFFRIALNPGNRELISLEEELENLRSYLMIEEARFGNRIKVAYRVGHGEGKWYIPQFTLQPLVENALKHGLSSREKGGLVTIETRKLNGDLQIMVEDNGKGIAREEIKNLLKPGTYTKAGCGIALANINQRLISLYGPEYQIKIESAEGSGTRAYLMIPQNSPKA